MTIRVCVIGAGAGGLVCLRHLMSRPNVFQAVAYEQTSRLGGTWVYTDSIGTDENGMPIHSSMYKYLRTNLPKEIMAFPDFPFNKNLPSFIGHEDVLKYLEDYADHFDVRKNVKFNTMVQNVSPVSCDTSMWKMKWKVEVQNVVDKTITKEEEFDAVMVCNGHYSVPLMPDIPGLKSFTGNCIHSHNYRYPTDYKGQRVLCLGAGASGQDVALDLAPFAQKVYLSHKKAKLQTSLPSNVIQVPGIDHINGGTITLTNDAEVEVDTLLFCTGYHYKYAFLDEKCKVTVDCNQRVTPLYQHTINTEFPTMSFIGIPKVILPFPLYDCQVRFMLAALDSSMELPSKEVMNADTQKDFEERLASDMPPRKAHTMSQRQWAYNDKLADLAGFNKLPKVLESLYEKVHDHRSTILPEYKQKNFEIISDTDFNQIN